MSAATVGVFLGRDSHELQHAVSAQERPTDALVRRGGPLDRLDWIWRLDGTALPRPDALRALLDAAERLHAVLPPVLLTSQVVGPDGELAPDHVPIAPQDQTAVAVQTVHLRVLHVRAASGASLLIRRSDFSDVLEHEAWHALAWTARRLRGGGGFLVPESKADAEGPVRGRVARARRFAPLLLGSALRPKERLRLATELGERGRAGA